MKHLKSGIHNVQHIQSAGLHAGLKSDPTKKDLALLYFPNGATVAGVFTRNLVKAWPVKHGQKALKNNDRYKAILINSGNANACNGISGQNALKTIIQQVATTCQISPADVLVSSTGIIGAPLKTEPFIEQLPTLFQSLQTNSSQDAAEAIMTTDTVKKETAYELEIDGKAIKIGAMAKGAGMIHPNMGTMLAYLVMDVACEQAVLQTLLQKAVDQSFNSLTVDGDTSTNDTVFLCTTGEHSIDLLNENNLAKLQSLITQACQDLAQMIARDGEGATKFITVQVQQAANDEDALTIAKAIATSNLFKTAAFGQDPNWGRIISAIGYSGVTTLDPDQIDIGFSSEYGQVKTCLNGAAIDFDLKLAQRILSAVDFTVEVNLKQGAGCSTIWTCDLSHDYVEINADYHT